MQLTQAEAAFRAEKDQLNLRPIWHWWEDRVQAHILFSFLAYVSPSRSSGSARSSTCCCNAARSTSRSCGRWRAGNTRVSADRNRLSQGAERDWGPDHGGFAVNFAVRLGPDDLAGRERLVHYMLRCPFSLERLIRVTDQGKVLYVTDNKAPRRFPKPASPDLFADVARNFQLFDPLDFIAELTQHIPDTRKHLRARFRILLEQGARHARQSQRRARRHRRGQ